MEKHNLPVQFNYIPYPLWRRRILAPLRAWSDPLHALFYPVHEDRQPPTTSTQMAAYLSRFGLLGTEDRAALQTIIETAQPTVKALEQPPTTSPESASFELPVRIPAQWEPMDAVIVNFPILYPPLWELHAQMIEAIAPVAQVKITVPARMWACAAWAYLHQRGNITDWDKLTFLVLPTDDIWVRDYGPIIGYDAQGQRVAFDAHYNRQDAFVNRRDDAMPLWWSGESGIPVLPLDLHTEGGNLWTDGAGTLFMTWQIFKTNPHFTQETLTRYLHTVFDFEKLILTPYMRLESTGHIDLLLKLADANTVLVSAPTTSSSAGRLALAAETLRHETNAAGEPYTLVELPTPPLYMNWGVYPIRRSYTNALTVNGRVLVPVYGIEADEFALRIYERTMPDHTIMPIDCRIGANGGGAVHCMTKEVPV